MALIWLILGTVILGLLVLSPPVAAALFGAYYRYNPALDARMAFWTRTSAERYENGGLGAIDPYARELSREITFRPGLLLRRDHREAK